MNTQRPNIILIMCDDLGYGDVGFNGNQVIHTPYLDAMRAEGARFTRFFAGGPVCSPTRGTCLTGRHYTRYGIDHANKGRLPTQEITLAKVCKEYGYCTGHFGKWHLGTMTTDVRDSNRGGPERPGEYSPPWLHGFDVCFSTEAKVPTWDPMVTPDERGPNGYRWGEPGTPYGTAYWNEQGEQIMDNLAGDNSRVIVDRVEPFIRECVSSGDPFLSVVWFHTPHTPVVAGPEYCERYADFSEEEQHYYGCITAMDEQVGRINQLLKELNVEDNTMIWFCSDNGPEGSDDLATNGRNQGVTGGLRGRKRSLFNGGIGVPALIKWPQMVTAGSEYTMPCSTLDYFPTVIDCLGYAMLDERPIDGMSLLPLFRGDTDARVKPIPYRFLERKEAMFGAPTLALMNDTYKFLTNLSEDGEEDLLFDMNADRAEETNIIHQYPKRVQQMRDHLSDFISSCRKSHCGEDYAEPYEPVNEFQELTGGWAVGQETE
ncbi:MAG: sulfatase-like hydrolase/transferase [Chloroflexota bacterium]